MKKIIAIVLVLIMALSLCACGEKERYPELADMLDAKNYENAMQYIYDLYQQDQLQGDGEDEGEGNEGEGNEGEGEGGEAEPTVTEPPRPTDEEWEVLHSYRSYVLTLGSYAKDGYISVCNDDSEWLEGSAALAYVYEKLDGLDKMVIDKWKITEYCGPDYISDYEGNAIDWDYNAYLAKFSHLENVLLKEEHTTLDNMENVEEQESYNEPYWQYNVDGTVSFVGNSSYAFEMTKSNPFNLYGTQQVTYDDAGKPTKIKYMSGDTVQYLVEITYDANGNKINEHVKQNSGELDITYEYDDQNRLVKIELPTYVDSDTIITYTYTYDDNGNVAKEVMEQHYYYEYYDAEITNNKTIRTFKYDENGNLISGTKKYENWGYNTNWDSGKYTVEKYIYQETLDQYTFTTDADGKLATVKITYGNTYSVRGDNSGEVISSPSYVSRTIEFVYGDYWFYTAE